MAGYRPGRNLWARRGITAHHWPAVHNTRCSSLRDVGERLQLPSNMQHAATGERRPGSGVRAKKRGSASLACPARNHDVGALAAAGQANLLLLQAWCEPPHVRRCRRIEKQPIEACFSTRLGVRGTPLTRPNPPPGAAEWRASLPEAAAACMVFSWVRPSAQLTPANQGCCFTSSAPAWQPSR